VASAIRPVSSRPVATSRHVTLGSWRAPCAALLLLGVLVLAPFARATSPGKNGRIAFMRKDAGGHWQIWVAGRRLTGATRLTAGPADSGWPVWSPDGSKIAFDSSRADPDPHDSNAVNDIFVMNASGTDVRKLTDSVGASADAAWSPDESLIAFDADRGDHRAKQGIYLVAAGGGQIRRVTTLPANDANDQAPRFSPDGKRLVFTRYRGTGSAEKAALFTVRLDGTQLRQLTTFSIHAGDADWSPDGSRIVFEAYPNPAAYGDVYVVEASGGRPVDLTRNPVGRAGSADPVWSPDGRTILFLDNRRVNGVGRTGLATMNPDGSARRFVSNQNVEEHQPDWESLHR
jgi:Tol biopolymer transport system component